MKFSAPLALLALSLPLAFAGDVHDVKKHDDKKDIELITVIAKKFELVKTVIDVKKGGDYGYHYDDKKDVDAKIFAFVLLDDKKDDKKDYGYDYDYKKDDKKEDDKKDYDYKKDEHKKEDDKKDDKKDDKHYRF